MARSKRQAPHAGGRTVHARQGTTVVVTELDPPSSARRGAPEPHPVDRLLERVSTRPVSTSQEEKVAAPTSQPTTTPATPHAKSTPGELTGLRVARVVELLGPVVQLSFRGRREPVPAQLAEGVDRELIAQAKANRESVLVECDPGHAPIVVGVVQTRIPRNVVIKGETVTIEADREILLRSGRSAVRLREDGDVELVGSRILAMSRGLFRIVGRILRLN